MGSRYCNFVDPVYLAMGLLHKTHFQISESTGRDDGRFKNVDTGFSGTGMLRGRRFGSAFQRIFSAGDLFAHG